MLEPILDLAAVSPQGYRLMVHFARNTHTHYQYCCLSKHTKREQLNMKPWMESERNADGSAVTDRKNKRMKSDSGTVNGL